MPAATGIPRSRASEASPLSPPPSPPPHPSRPCICISSRLVAALRPHLDTPVVFSGAAPPYPLLPSVTSQHLPHARQRPSISLQPPADGPLPTCVQPPSSVARPLIITTRTRATQSSVYPIPSDPPHPWPSPALKPSLRPYAVLPLPPKHWIQGSHAAPHQPRLLPTNQPVRRPPPSKAQGLPAAAAAGGPGPGPGALAPGLTPHQQR
jgi:hypothetical protein